MGADLAQKLWKINVNLTGRRLGSISKYTMGSMDDKKNEGIYIFKGSGAEIYVFCIKKKRL